MEPFLEIAGQDIRLGEQVAEEMRLGAQIEAEMAQEGKGFINEARQASGALLTGGEGVVPTIEEGAGREINKNLKNILQDELQVRDAQGARTMKTSTGAIGSETGILGEEAAGATANLEEAAGATTNPEEVAGATANPEEAAGATANPEEAAGATANPKEVEVNEAKRGWALELCAKRPILCGGSVAFLTSTWIGDYTATQEEQACKALCLPENWKEYKQEPDKTEIRYKNLKNSPYKLCTKPDTDCDKFCEENCKVNRFSHLMPGFLARFFNDAYNTSPFPKVIQALIILIFIIVVIVTILFLKMVKEYFDSLTTSDYKKMDS